MRAVKAYALTVFLFCKTFFEKKVLHSKKLQKEKSKISLKFSTAFFKRLRSQGRGALVASAEAKRLLPSRGLQGRSPARRPLDGEIYIVCTQQKLDNLKTLKQLLLPSGEAYFLFH